MIKQVVQTAIGKPSEVVKVVEADLRSPNANEVAIAMKASPINPADLLRLSGTHAYVPDLPSVPGIEGVGVVEAVGAGVAKLAVGDVVLLPYGGAWTERCIRSIDQVVPLPAGIDWLQASMLGVNPMTAVGMLTAFRDLKPGDWIIQNAANSAVGKLVIQNAAKRGIRTVNIVRRESLIPDLKQLGADVVIVGTTDFAPQVAAATNHAEIHLALDAIAGQASAQLVQCLAESSTLIIYGLLSGDPVQLPAAAMVFKDITVTGFSRIRMLSKLGRDRAQAMYWDLAQMVISGELKTAITATYPMTQIQAALTHADQPGRDGKVAIVFDFLSGKVSRS